MILYEYYNSNSVIHRMNPLVKLFWLIALTLIVFIISETIYLLIIIVFLIFLILLAKIPFSYLFYYLKIILIFLMITYVLLFLITQESISKGIVFLIKISILVISMILFVLTTPKKELINALIKLRMPYSFAFTLTIALQFLPLLLKDFRDVLRAQKSRGHKLVLNPFKPLKSAKSYYPVLIPSFILLFKHAFEMSLSAEARGFRPDIYKKKKMKFALADLISLIVLICLVVARFIFQ